MSKIKLPQASHLTLPDTIDLFGLKLSRMTYKQTLDWLDASVLKRENSRACVFSANVDQLVRYHNDLNFRETYKIADLIIPDGMPVVWSTKLVGTAVPERVAGIDLLYGLCSRAVQNGQRCFLLGALADVVQAAADNLQQRFPRLVICGWQHGYFQRDEPIIHSINAARTDLLFVGMGSPRQEIWLHNNFPRLHCRLAMPVGGTFEVLAGRRRRAPALVQKTGMEWAWRMLQEPRRLGKRYLVEDLRFVPMVFGELRSRRKSAGQA
jgi:N-acetylglucosaminyldiphosphoundecaprenol N-acetyl-beta-D-mannosaminyltransferase